MTWLASLKTQPAPHSVVKPGAQKPGLQQESTCVCVCVCVRVRVCKGKLWALLPSVGDGAHLAEWDPGHNWQMARSHLEGTARLA